MTRILSSAEFKKMFDSPSRTEECSALLGTNYVVVQTTGTVAAKFRPPCPVIGAGPYDPSNTHVDVYAESEQEVELLCTAIDRQPLAAATLIQILRAPLDDDIATALMRESLAYSTLQQSQGFQSWLASRATPTMQSDESPLIIDREAASLHITFNRAHSHNAYSTQLKDEFCAALHLVHEDSTINEVIVDGHGPSFCAGGDLREFGSVSDAGIAHLSRTTRSTGYLIATAAAHTQFNLHGACIGAGIELPAFGNSISAHADSFFQLPEVSFGLVPGAGGTVSLPRRIGRLRTAYLALSNQRIDARTALEWGLIDAIS